MYSEENIIFKVDEASDLPIWVQLRNRILHLIRTGYFKAGDQLPSVRSLAADAKINYNTVTKAYRDLELNGLIVSLRGRGMFVQKDIELPQTQEDATDVMLETCIKQYRSYGMTYKEIRERMMNKVQAFEDVSREQEERATYGSIQ